MMTLEQEPQVEQQTGLSYETFKELPDWQRMRIVADNPILNTDTYNRTMDYLRGPEGWKEQETYVLQMRKSPYGYLVAVGIEDLAAQISDMRITQEMLDFAEAAYAEQNIPFFNKDMWQTIIDENEGRLPIEIFGAPDGTVMIPGEPMIRVSGPGELIAHFEHLFHRPFYSTLVATKAHEISKLVGPDRFIEVGKRGTPDELTHLMAAKAMMIGGGINRTSNDAAVAGFEGLDAVGTIGHRYVQRFPSVEAAFRHAIEHLSAVSLLVDLVESYQGLDLALQLKEEYRHTDKMIWARLDSGTTEEIAAQVRYYLDETAKRGFTDPKLDKVVVEGVDSLEDIAFIEATLTDEEKQRVIYGAGGLLVSQNTTRSDASTGFKLSEYEYRGDMLPCQKFSNSPGKASLPGEPTVVVRGNQRIIAQYRELVGTDLLELLSSNGIRLRQATRPEEAYRLCRQQYQVLERRIANGESTPKSVKTIKKIGQVMCKYGLNKED